MSLERRYVDILTMGRSGIDIFPLQVGAHLEDVETFGKFLGGSPTNVAVAAARENRVLADRLGGTIAREIALVAAGTIALIVLARISIPLPFTPVPVSLGTLGALSVGTTLGARVDVMRKSVDLAVVGQSPFHRGARYHSPASYW